MPNIIDTIKDTVKDIKKDTITYPTFKKRVNPHGRSLRSNNIYYKPPKNNSLFNSASGGNCVWYAYGRFLEVWATAPKAQRDAHPWKGFFNGNGYQMVSQARARGFKTGLTPKPGALICWGYYGSASGSPGHVAFVEDVRLDKNGRVKSIEISQSGWSSGDMKNQTLYPGTGQLGTGAYKTGYNNSYFLGFAYNPITFAGSDGVVKGSGSIGGIAEEGGGGIDFQKRASKLSSSDNFTFISNKEESEQLSPTEQLGISLASQFKTVMTSLNSDYINTDYVVNNTIADNLIVQFNKLPTMAIKPKKTKSYLSIADNTVEAPYIEMNIGGYKVGSYKGDIDEYPNYISKLSVNKQNGVINQYNIQMIHQVRPGDDSNLIDELLSKANYDKIEIKYGDLNSGQYFQDTKAIITNVYMNRNYTNMSISYTIEATSEGSLLKTLISSFPERIDKPSNVLRDLLYSNDKISNLLLEAFPGMKDKLFVDSNNLIPSNDSVVKIMEQYNVNVLDYVNYLVGCMSNNLSKDDIIRNSTYYITYNDADSFNRNGAYFKITEVTADMNPFTVTDKVYEITVGYNDNIVYDFNVDTTQSWELLYKNASKAEEYYYTVTNNGDINKYYSPAVVSSTNFMNELNKNWWTQMIKFPLTASITIKGLLKPVMLMDYIKIDVVFYGNKHITSGIYAITGQQDILSGSGFKTTLSLVRVTDNV